MRNASEQEGARPQPLAPPYPIDSAHALRTTKKRLGPNAQAFSGYDGNDVSYLLS
jgi:hypothetical protein